MRDIYFVSEKEVIYFCEIVFRMQNEIHVHWKKDKHWGNHLHLFERGLKTDIVITSFIEVFIYYRLNSMIQDVIRNTYRYKDKVEIERIIELTNWAISEQMYVKQLFGKEQMLRQFLDEQMRESITDKAIIHFDSIIMFCMKPLRNSIVKAVGYAIDEFKREEEYQNYVQSVREFISNRTTRTSEIHIVQGETFTYYKANGKSYSSMELRTMMHNEPLYMIGLDENEMNLSPIITLLPERIYIYGNNPTDAKTITIIKLFEEKAKFYPMEQFPFRNRKN